MKRLKVYVPDVPDLYRCTLPWHKEAKKECFLRTPNKQNCQTLIPWKKLNIAYHVAIQKDISQR